MRFNAADWRGCVVVIDEAAQVIAADAQLDAHHLAAFEAATGTRALLIGSEHRPAEDRELWWQPDRNSWRREIVEHLRQRRRVWISTTAQQAGAANSAQNLEILAWRHWPGGRVLRVDSETVADPNHDAHRLAADPDGIAAAYDVVVASPAVAAGLSVTLRGHFAAVFVGSGGTTDPEAVAQAAARVRDDCRRYVYAPDRSPGAALRVGCGSFDPQELLHHQAQHGAAIAAQLASTMDLATGTQGPWLPLWAAMAAATNRKAAAYAATVRGLLEQEGYRVIEAAPLSGEAVKDAAAIAMDLREIAQQQQDAEDAATIAAPLLSDAAAAELQKRRRLQPAERAQLRRWRIAKAWGLGAAPPTAEVIEADRQQRSQRGRFGWALQSIEARQLVARHDHATAQQLGPRGVGWVPDLCRQQIGPKLAAADALGLPAWLSRSGWFEATDAQLLDLQATATAHAASLRQVLGVSPGKTGAGTLRVLLRLFGYRLEAKRSKAAANRDAMTYRVVPEPLPKGITTAQLEAAWAAQLGGTDGHVFPLHRRGENLLTLPGPSSEWQL
jgi:hypothetical protein